MRSVLKWIEAHEKITVVPKVRRLQLTFRKCTGVPLGLNQNYNILVLLIAIMNHKFCLISTKYVINPALIHIAHYITTDRTLKIEPAALLSQLSCTQYFQKYCMFPNVSLVFVKKKKPKTCLSPF